MPNSAFTSWFKQSKVVDANGAPLVVFHGTRKDFCAFDLTRAGEVGDRFADAAFFTDSPEVAAAYASPWTGNDEFNSARKAEDEALSAWGRAVLEHGRHSPEDKAAEIEKDARADERRRAAADVDAMRLPSTGANLVPVHLSLQNPLVKDAKGAYYFTVYKEAFSQAKAEGHDGIVILNVVDAASVATQVPTNVYVAFSATQIKSAVGHGGAYDPCDPDITDRRATAALGALAWIEQSARKVAPHA